MTTTIPPWGTPELPGEPGHEGVGHFPGRTGRQDRVKNQRVAASKVDAARVTTSRDLPSHLVHAAAPRLFLALWGGLAVVDVARVGQAPASLQVGLLAALAGVCSIGQRIGPALAVAGTVWLVALGFVVNTSGVLALTGPADGLRLALLVTTALAATTLGSAR